MMTTTELDEILGRATGVSLTDNDVVFGRGGFTNRHPANVEYLKLLGEHEEAYMDCKRKYQKLLSLCIIHQLRCKGVRFLKKDEKTGTWKTVQLTQCRLKISQRLRERAPFIKMEQMNASRGLTKMIRRAASPRPDPVHSDDDANQPASFPPTRTLPAEIITVSDASSDEEDSTESIGFDDMSSSGEDDFSLRNAFESIMEQGEGPFEYWGEENFQQEQECCPTQGKRSADSMFAPSEEPQCKRLRKVSMDEQDYANMLLKDDSLLEDISVASFDYDDDIEATDFQSDSIDQDVFAPSSEGGDDELFEYLQVLF